MATTKKDPVLVVLQLTGANDYLNTIVPYTNPYYRDARPRVGIAEDEVLPIDDELGFNPHMGPVKQYLMMARWRLSMVSVTRTHRGPIFVPWTSGTPASPTL